MKVLVVKIGRYDPTACGALPRYKGYADSTKQLIELPLVPSACAEVIRNVGIKQPFITLGHSTLLRGVQTANCIKATNKVPCIFLNEIKFDLTNLVSEEEFNTYGSALVRERFVEAFINDSLLESRESLSKRIEAIFNFIAKNEGENICLVSHSFVMKLLESFVNGVDVFLYPERLCEFIKPQEKTYEFGKGFSFVL